MKPHQNWTRLLIIALMFLGYAAIASEASHNIDAETETHSYVIEAPSSVFTDDPEPNEQPTLPSNSPLPINPFHTNLYFSQPLIVATDSLKHKSFTPRAPPSNI